MTWYHLDNGVAYIHLRGKRGADKFALVNPGDLKMIAEYSKKWWLNNHGYAWGRSPGLRRGLQLHQVLMGEAPEKGLSVDHISQDRLDNRRENLRWANRSLQMRNRRSRGASKFRGVYKDGKRWRAHLWTGSMHKHLGNFSCEEDAARASMAARKKAFPDEPYEHEEELTRGTVLNFFAPCTVNNYK